MKRLERLERLAQQTTGRPPESAVDVRVFDYGVGSVWLGRFDHDIMMASLAVVPEPPAEEGDRTDPNVGKGADDE